jgi:hypothetical protein
MTLTSLQDKLTAFQEKLGVSHLSFLLILIGLQLVFLLMLILLLRRKDRKILFTKSKPKAESDEITGIKSPEEGESAEVTATEQEPYTDRFEVIAMTPVTDPLQNSGVVSKQINPGSNFLTTEDILAILNLVVTALPNAITAAISMVLLSDENSQLAWVGEPKLNAAGFAGKVNFQGNNKNVLFGEVTAIARSTTQFHPEIALAIATATANGNQVRLMAIDGLGYLAIELKQVS